MPGLAGVVVRRVRGAAVAVAVAIAAAGCMSIGAMPDTSAMAPIVSLPIAAAGVRDARLSFARLFEAELRQHPGDGAPGRRWLDGVPQDVAGATPGVDAALKARFGARAPGTVVLVVPGLFGDCVAAQSVPFGDGVMRTPERSLRDAYGQYADLGLKDVRMVALPGRASVAENARLLARELRATAAAPGVERIVLVGYSKGVSDAMQALHDLEHDGGVPASVRALVSVGGIVMGTPVADWNAGWYEMVTAFASPLDCTPSRGGEIAGLVRTERAGWLAAHPLPASVRYLSVVAHAHADEVAWPLKTFHRRLAAMDARNDGQLFASDGILPGGALLAQVRIDHWGLALPLERHPNPLIASFAGSSGFPREALFRALVKEAVAGER